MTEKSLDYVSFLFRLWKSGVDNRMIWCASLDCTQDGKHFEFPHLKNLIAYLVSEFGQEEDNQPMMNSKLYLE